MAGYLGESLAFALAIVEDMVNCGELVDDDLREALAFLQNPLKHANMERVAKYPGKYASNKRVAKDPVKHVQDNLQEIDYSFLAHQDSLHKFFFARMMDCEILMKAWSRRTKPDEDYLRRSTTSGDPRLWSSFVIVKDKNYGLGLNFQSEQEFFNWCSEAVHSFDRQASERPGDMSPNDVQRWLQASPAALICHHREGSFDLTPETLAHCLHVANVISVSCFLFCLRIGHFQESDGSEIDKSRLLDHLHPLVEKWKWGGEKCRHAFNEWICWIQEVCSENLEETLKLLYQWTLHPLDAVMCSVECEMLGANPENLGEVDRAMKWAGEVGDFLEDGCRVLFKSSEEVFFFGMTMFRHHIATVDLLLMLGNRSQAVKLVDLLTDIGEDLKKDLPVARLAFPGKIVYTEFAFGPRYDPHAGSDEKIEPDDDTEAEPFQTVNNIRVARQRNEIASLIEKDRYSEAWKIIEEIASKFTNWERKILLVTTVAGLDEPINSDLNSTVFDSQVKLSSRRKRMEFVIDVCETYLPNTDHWTARCLDKYATLIVEEFAEAAEILNPKQDFSSEFSPALLLWLPKECNLQNTMLMDERIHGVVSCLWDPTGPGEHKRDDLPDPLKAYRVGKRSLDLTYEMLHHWQGTASESYVWLKLLEMQENRHCSVLEFLVSSAAICFDVGVRRLQKLEESDTLKDLIATDSSLSVCGKLYAAFTISALAWVEKGRARTLLTQLGPWYKMRDGVPSSLKEELIKFDKDRQAFMSSMKSSTSACKEKTLFIEYIVLDLVKACLMTADLIPDIEPCKGDGQSVSQVEELVNEFYKIGEKFRNTKPLPRRLEDGVVEELHKVLEKLYDILIQPFSRNKLFENLDPQATIVFIPDKVLYRVPFALLRDKNTQKYLFELHPIAISPCLRVLQHCKQQLRELEKRPLKPDGCILAVGDAAYEKNRLPGTREELESLRSSFPGRVKTLEQEEATRANFLEVVQEPSRSKEDYVFAFIHLGVHGHWSKTDPRDIDEAAQKQYNTGALQFAMPPVHSRRSDYELPIATTDLNSRDVGTPSQIAEVVKKDLKSETKCSSGGEIRQARAFGEVGAVSRAPDGYRSAAAGDMLPSEDIINGGFQWRTRLVVLSACNSFRGKLYSDGEVNLPRALMVAGVPAALVSQWKISDVGSPRLMKAFYEHWRLGKDVATALQSAMIQLYNDQESESANNIFEWGPFLVWGLPNVQLPKELLIESVGKAISKD